jgi:plastocyanin
MTLLRTTFICLTGSTLVLAGCGGETRNADSTNTSSSAAAPPSTTAGTPGSTPAAGSTSAGATMAPTGKTWDVKMIGDATGYRFEPTTLTIKQGDAVRWTVVSGPPHNVTFWPDSIPSGANGQLQANMPNTMSPLSGPLDSNIGATYTVSFAGVPAGTYKYYCTPHLTLGMKAQLTVQ